MEEQQESAPTQKQRPVCDQPGCAALAVVRGQYGTRCEAHVPEAPGEYAIERCVRITCRCGHQHVVLGNQAVLAAENLQDIGAPCRGCLHMTKAQAKSRIVLARAGIRR